MDTCVRSLSLVHHIASLNSVDSRVDMNEKGRCRNRPQVETFEEEIICPKPRRVALSCCAPEFMKPAPHWQSSSRIAECEAGYEILEIFLKGVCGDEEILNVGCSPPYCSPTSRASNPIIHDLRFGSQRSCSSPAPYSKSKSNPVVHDLLYGGQRSCSPKLISMPESMKGSTISTSPSVRIEGFDCSRMEMRRDGWTTYSGSLSGRTF